MPPLPDHTLRLPMCSRCQFVDETIARLLNWAEELAPLFSKLEYRVFLTRKVRMSQCMQGTAACMRRQAWLPSSSAGQRGSLQAVGKQPGAAAAASSMQRVHSRSDVRLHAGLPLRPPHNALRPRHVPHAGGR